jgi:sialic acid synthase SpsE/sugar phosphate isomerase/epimerase
MKTLLIAEIGNNHNGSLERAFKLIDAISVAGVQIAKFQLRNLGSLYRERDVEDLGVEYAKDLLKKYNLSFEQHQEIAAYCETVGVEYMCTPWDIKSVGQLEELGVKRYKIASADFDNIPLLECIAKTRKPMYLSTGMNTTKEISKISKFLDSLNVDYTLLHCNSTYPAPFVDIELNFLKELQMIHSPVGYSGHERGIAVSVAAVAMGATVIERHVTIDKNLEGPDHHASLLPEELAHLCKMISEVEQAMGAPKIIERKLSQGALLNKENLGKSIVATMNLESGTVISKDHLEVLAPGQGMSPNQMPDLIGKKLKRSVNKHEFLFLDHFQANTSKLSIENLGNNWGVPVRPHDFMIFHSIFDAPVYEFHISYKDLDRLFFSDDLKKLRGREIIVHAPELFSDSMLLDLCAADEISRSQSISNLQKVCDYCTKLVRLIGIDRKIKIVANVGGFSTHSFRDESEKPYLYNLIGNSISELDQPFSEIIPQNMAPFPWHFGGQRYQNVFMIPEEIREFCENHDTKICLDTAHLSMYCHFSKRNFFDCLDILLPITAHFHMSDAKGINGEGVIMGSGDVNFGAILNSISMPQTYIVETWQGHKNDGSGFMNDLSFLNKLVEI